MASMLEREAIARGARGWILWVTLIAIAAIVAVIVFTGNGGQPFVDLAIEPSGHPEVLVEAPAPAHVQEQIAFGELGPGDRYVSAEILPVHVVEGIIFGDVDPPTGL